MSFDGLQDKLLGTFIEESREGLASAEASLLLMGAGGSPDDIDDVFRAMHSLKGSAGSMGQGDLARVAHELETHLDQLRQRRQAPEAALLKLMLQTIDGLRHLLELAARRTPVDAALADALATALKSYRPPQATRWLIRFDAPADLLTRGLEPTRLFRALAELGPLTVTADTSRVPAFTELSPRECFLQWDLSLPTTVERRAIEEVFDWVDGGWTVRSSDDAPPSAAAAVGPVVAVAHAAADGAASIRIPIDRIDLLMNMVGELVITQAMLGELEDDGPIDKARAARLRDGLALLARNTHALQDSVMRLRSVPLSVVLGRLPRLVHDLSEQLGKEVSLWVSGETTELDKTVIERLGDPLIHLVRNCMDHGLETPAERVAAGKPAVGALSITASQKGGEVFIEVSDDGRGLDLDAIFKRGQERGLLPAGAPRPSDDELTRLVFEPGFSTAQAVTDVSGRGVGMDVVQRNVKRLGGDVVITSKRHVGTHFMLRLPVSLAIIDGQLVKVGDHTWVIPLLSILETVQPEPSQLGRLGNGQVLRLRDQLIPTLPLAPLLGLPSTGTSPLMVIVEGDGQPVGLLVDELLGQQQVVVKSLESNYGSVRGVQGATILGDGSVSFILEVAGLVRGASLPRSAS